MRMWFKKFKDNKVERNLILNMIVWFLIIGKNR